MAVVEQLEQVASGLGVEGAQPPVVEHDQVGPGQCTHELGEAPVGVG